MQPANTITVGSVRAFIGSTFAKRRRTDLRPRSHNRRNTDRHSERRPNHFPGAPGPADVLPRLLDRNGKIVFARVVTRRGAGWTPGHPVPANLPPDLNMVQNPELHAKLRVRHSISPYWWLVLGHNGIANLTDQRPQGIFR
jgi:hypothetical protein